MPKPLLAPKAATVRESKIMRFKLPKVAKRKKRAEAKTVINIAAPAVVKRNRSARRESQQARL